MDLNTATTYRHGREDVLVALARLDAALRGHEDGVPVRVGAVPFMGGTSHADAWNLRVVLEELRAQLEEGHDRAAPGTIRVNVRPEVDTEALGDLASALADAVADRLADRARPKLGEVDLAEAVRLGLVTVSWGPTAKALLAAIRQNVTGAEGATDGD